jgi:hypothetical protein
MRKQTKVSLDSFLSKFIIGSVLLTFNLIYLLFVPYLYLIREQFPKALYSIQRKKASGFKIFSLMFLDIVF